MLSAKTSYLQRNGSANIKGRSEYSCHRISSPSGPREHLSLSLNWIQSLIKTLFRGEVVLGMMLNSFWQSGSSLRGSKIFFHTAWVWNTKTLPTENGIQNWAFKLLHCWHNIILFLLLVIPTFQPVVHHLSCQPLYSQPTGFSAIVDLKPRWLENKGLARPLQSPLNTLIPDAACKQRATDSSSLQPGRLRARSENILCGDLNNIYQKRHILVTCCVFFLSFYICLV